MRSRSFTSTTQTRLYNRGTSLPPTKMTTTSNRYNNSKTTTNKLLMLMVINNSKDNINNNKKNDNNIQMKKKFKGRISISLFLISMLLYRKNKLQGKRLSIIKGNSIPMITNTSATTSKHSTASTTPTNLNHINNNPISTPNNSLNNTKSNLILKYSPISKDSKVSIDQYKLLYQLSNYQITQI